MGKNKQHVNNFPDPPGLAAEVRLLDHLLRNAGELRETARLALESSLDLLSMEIGALYLNRTSGLRLVVARDPQGYLPRSIPRRNLGRAARQNCCLKPGKPDKNAAEDGVTIELGAGSGIKLLCLIPLIGEKHRLLGLLVIACRKHRQLSADTLRRLGNLSDRIASALDYALTVKRLAESESRYRAVLNRASEGFALFRGNRLIEMNTAFENILQQFTASPSSLSPDYLFPDGVPPESDTWNREMQSPDGQRRWLTVSRSLLDMPGNYSAFFVRDNTEQRQWEWFRIMSERLAATGSLAAGLAHEINNPLQALTINLSLLTMQIKPGPREQDLIDGIHTGLKTIRETVQQLQEIQSTGRSPRRRIQINQVLKKTLGLATGQLEKSHVIVQASLASHLPTTTGSTASLQRAFLNIVLNACDAMAGGGTLHVHTYHHRGAVYVRFTDSGVGIAEDHLNQIFDAYYTTKTRAKGSGLGLPIALNLLRQHDGEVYVKSRPGLGTSFTIKLPLPER